MDAELEHGPGFTYEGITVRVSKDDWKPMLEVHVPWDRLHRSDECDGVRAELWLADCSGNLAGVACDFIGLIARMPHCDDETPRSAIAEISKRLDELEKAIVDEETPTLAGAAG